MTIRKVVWLMSAVMLVLVPMLLSQTVNQAVGDAGQVDWTSQVIRATGIGAPNPAMPVSAQRAGAIEAAKRVALRNLLETIKGMNLTSETTIRNAMMENDVIVTKVSGVVRGFTVVDTKYMSTGDIEVTVEMPITGALLDAVLPQQMGQALGTLSRQQQQMPATQTGVYTGLIVDARGLGVRPAMAPKILDENNQEVYGSRYVSREWAVKIGMVGYDKDLNKARNNDRVAGNPLIVKAIKVVGPNKADVVVSNDVAAQIRNAAANQNFLDKCKVMFIVD